MYFTEAGARMVHYHNLAKEQRELRAKLRPHGTYLSTCPHHLLSGSSNGVPPSRLSLTFVLHSSVEAPADWALTIDRGL